MMFLNINKGLIFGLRWLINCLRLKLNEYLFRDFEGWSNFKFVFKLFKGLYF